MLEILQGKETVTYERLVNTGNYENRRFSVTLLVNPGDQYDQVFKRATEIVDAQADQLKGKLK